MFGAGVGLAKPSPGSLVRKDGGGDGQATGRPPGARGGFSFSEHSG